METVAIKTSAQTNMLNITPEIQRLIRKHGWKDGLITVFVPHTTAGVTINENADPDVVRDILFQIDKVIPFEDDYHHFEGNSPAHIKASLFGSSVTIIMEHGRMMLGTWQGVFFCEFDGPRNRKFWVKFMQNSEQ